MLNLFSLLAFEGIQLFNNWDVVLVALDFLWKGLLAIFVVIGLIILVVKITAYCIATAEARKAQGQQNDGENNPS